MLKNNNSKNPRTQQGKGKSPTGAGEGSMANSQIKSRFVSHRPRTSNDDFDQIILEIKRVTRVTGGGKKLSFRAAVLLGNHKNKIGFGLAKGSDVPQAIDKAKREALKDMVTIPIEKDTIPFAVSGKYCASVVMLKPAKAGKGIIAGGTVREIIKMTGIKNITSKILGGSHNVVNNTKAFLLATSKLNRKVKEEDKLATKLIKENNNKENNADTEPETKIS
jgi:small subunit ribosomal protein S5